MTELIMGRLITRARARRRATRKLREKARTRTLLVSVASTCRILLLALLLLTVCCVTVVQTTVYGLTTLSKEERMELPLWTPGTRPRFIYVHPWSFFSASFLFFHFVLLQAKERCRRKNAARLLESRSMAQGRQAHARAEAALPLAHVPRGARD